MKWFSAKRIFLDYASATPVCEEARREMKKYWSEEFYNPNAIYAEGLRAKAVVEDCRARIAKIIGAGSKDIIFTAGGTEANVLAITGVKPGRIVVEEGSHPSVSEAANGISGKEITLISSVATDNKLGRKIREERKKNPPAGGSEYPLLHIDASQTAAYFNVGLEVLSCDLLTLDSAKLYGPKGVGALVVKRGVELKLPPRGTPPVPLIVGFAKALEIVARDRETEFKRLSALSALFRKMVGVSLPEAQVTYNEPNIVNVSVSGILPELLVLALERASVLVSAGPACNSSKPEAPDTPVRVSLGRFTTENDVKKAAEIFCNTVKNLIKS
ncbi:MAG: Cysteine desulfurase [Parcubacteria group bacterium GW2011_GWB1_49_7]|uniref:Aminotransferase class V domain-containing protein n=1 Tax=Candidatus Zambryskibacteria bacterium RIFCSPHIGHO2_01_FULL_46_25 TaxID=1802738 RepID=A0A1G2T0L8_9BACT|nr:MAG: Cysteine desulfurase [Parcubacteria group bacterium GW2011_GWB1_49_7]OHA90379.1 MAG: hypothetical protein A2838_02155 [Candidatus Zambryskibacteria bacterium RIFCSPHIGHO2_01_FULL_46_25]OHB06916.1 MAG: hypothetical protein A3A31_01290 [Candidatus Zambryskibacteria bacterium RIFCSPLOWO2_01_FULL_48_25]